MTEQTEEQDIPANSKYKPEYKEMMIEYFDIDPSYKTIKQVETKSGDVLDMEVEIANDLPLLSSFAAKIGVHRETLLNWSKDFPDFGEVYKVCKDHQERILVCNGLQGRYQPAFAIFTAKNVLGWRDKQELSGEVKGSGVLVVPGQMSAEEWDSDSPET